MKEKERERQRKLLLRYAQKAGRIGGKPRLETMTQAKRTKLAYDAGVQGGRPVVIDHQKVLELRAAGKLGREIAAELGISQPSVWRILRAAGKKMTGA